MLRILILILSSNFVLEIKGEEQCIGKDGHPYRCDGFCCAGLGCCSHSGLWYAWTLFALVIIACLCGCASCGMRRHHMITAYATSHPHTRLHRCTNMATSGGQSRAQIPGHSNRQGALLNTRHHPNWVTYNAISEHQYKPTAPNVPPSYAASTAPPPPYSEH